MERKHHLRTVRNKTSRKLDYLLLGVILIVAAVLRLWKLGQVPFMHDELSAWFRLRYDNFHDLIQYGVCENDSHPAGVQVFLYYWTKLVGWNELWIKLPFALMGIGSVFLIYRIGKQWFNNKVGLLSAAFFAVSQLTVFYSQLARPYAAGLFFILFMTFFWNKILFDAKKPSVGTCIGFAVTTCLAALAHNFSTALAGLIFLTGLFFLKKDRRKAYWLGGAGALLLYSPHFPVFYHQTFVYGSIGGWLSKPEATFLTDFLQYTMNYAPLFMFAVGFLIILPLILGKREKHRKPVRWAAAAWFFLLFGLALAYSLLREPILQFSTLIFCYPFLVIAAFSLYRNNTMTMTQTAVAVAALLFIGSMTLIVNRQHYDLMYHQGFDQIAVRIQQDHDSLTDIRFATITEETYMAEYYQDNIPVDKRIVFGRGNDVADLRQWLQQERSENLGLGWTDYIPPVWETQAVAYYPWLIQEDTWFTSKYFTLSRDSVPGARHLLHTLSEERFSFVNMEWGRPYFIDGDSVDSHTDLLGVVANIQAIDTITHCVLVMEVHDKTTDSILHWQGTSEKNGILLPGTNMIVNAIRFDTKHFPIQGKKIKTDLWNQDKGTMIVSRMDWYDSKFNTRLTGLYQPL